MSQERQQEESAPIPSNGGGEGDKGTKRARSEAFGDESEQDGNSGEVVVQSPKRTARSHDVLFRLVVPSNQIGRVIGREGHRIQKIREESKATIKIADAVDRHEERVIIISSSDTDKEISDAENALFHIAKVILKEDTNGVEPSKLGVQHVASNMVRLLIAGSQAGCLIGKSGQNIEKIRNSSGATITIMAQNQLPLCASAHESDRLVQISGNVPEVLKALEQIGCQLRENPTRKVVSIRETHGFNSNGANQTSIAQTSDYVTSDLMIPETLVGGLIGKCGTNISNIRLVSGAQIKVSGGKGEQNLRDIHIQGSAHQVALARKLIDDYIYSQTLEWRPPPG